MNISNISRKGRKTLISNRKNVNKMHIDWAKSPLYFNIKNGDAIFDLCKDPNIYYDFEVNYVISKVKEEAKGNDYNNIKIYHRKALNTFNKLVGELAVAQLFNELSLNYSDVI